MRPVGAGTKAPPGSSASPNNLNRKFYNNIDALNNQFENYNQNKNTGLIDFSKRLAVGTTVSGISNSGPFGTSFLNNNKINLAGSSLFNNGAFGQTAGESYTNENKSKLSARLNNGLGGISLVSKNDLSSNTNQTSKNKK
jgi:hypothetical protein